MRAVPRGRRGWTGWHFAPRFIECCDCAMVHELQYERDGERLYIRLRRAKGMTRKVRRRRK